MNRPNPSSEFRERGIRWRLVTAILQYFGFAELLREFFAGQLRYTGELEGQPRGAVAHTWLSQSMLA
jgi:hypothetical protein